MESASKSAMPSAPLEWKLDTPEYTPYYEQDYTPSTSTSTTSTPIKVMQYNILADCYAHSDSFSAYCTEQTLDWDSRFKLLAQQIQTADADIVCLQEVEFDTYHDLFKDYFLENGGYSSLFKKRPHPHKKDGCAILYREAKLEVLTKAELSYNSLAKVREKHGDRAQTNNIAIALYFQEVATTRRRFWVVNTHLFWDPKAPDVKLGQAKMLKKFVTNQLQRSPGGVIICGDFNSTPDSSVCEYMQKGDMFVSAYPVEVSSAHPTNVTPGFVGCIDYIWYTCADLQVQSTVDLKTTLGESKFLPDIVHPSDHLPLVAEFIFREESALMMSRHGVVDKCRYDLLCRRINCKYSHSLLCSAGIDCPNKETCRHAHVIPCRFGLSCFKEGCKFNHLPCKFGPMCTNPNCKYSH